MKILVADEFPAFAREELTGKGHTLTYNESLTGDALRDAIAGYEVLIVRSTEVTAAVLDAGDALKLVIRAGAGYNTIDTAHAKAKGIAVCNCPGTNSVAVAELALGLMLALDRRIPDNVAASRDGVWNKKSFSKARGLYGQTLAIIGLGSIGREVALRAKAFGLKLVGYDPYANAAQASELGIRLVESAIEAASQADIVTVHVPAAAETKNLCNGAFFAAMNDGAMFINTSRADVVDEAALREAVADKRLRVGLDVFKGEPEAKEGTFEFALAKQAGVYVTHHIGASTTQAQDAVAVRAVEIIDEFSASGKTLYRVNG